MAIVPCAGSSPDSQSSHACRVLRLLGVDRCEVRPELIQRRIERMRFQIRELRLAVSTPGQRQQAGMLACVPFYYAPVRLVLHEPEQRKQFAEHANGTADRTAPNRPATRDELVEFRESRDSVP